MKEMVRCKACGFIVAKDELGEVCPACGVKKEFFEPWDDKVGVLRRTILDLHLHPIIVHVPQTLAILVLLVVAVYPLVPPGFQTPFLWPVVQFLSWLFPLAVLGGYLSGIVDAKVRYRVVAAPLLVKKLVWGLLFQLTSAAQAVLVSVGGFGAGSFRLWLASLVVSAASLACASVLGHWGAALFAGVMPGKKIFHPPKKKAAKPSIDK